MKQLQLIILLIGFFFPVITWGNMASPIQEGSWLSSPFISQQVDILREELLLKPAADFKTAQYKVTYHIRAQEDGVQIPLLFFAAEYQAGFQVWLDGDTVALQQVPANYQKFAGSAFNDFAYIFDQQEEDFISLTFEDSLYGNFYLRLEDLKFFEVDLSAGEHTIEVQYLAEEWVNYEDWIKDYSFRYVLSPAKYWKSFGSLDITLDATQIDQVLTTNLGTPTTGDLNSIAKWHFESLPVEVMEVHLKPEPSKWAKMLLALTPFGMMLFLAIPLIIAHYFAIRRHRKLQPDLRYSWVLNVGSMVVPLLILIFYVYCYTIIDQVLGPHASNYHGYIFLLVLLYPVVFPVYWLLMWLVERLVRRRAL